jgi:hypothetical protein
VFTGMLRVKRLGNKFHILFPLLLLHAVIC